MEGKGGRREAVAHLGENLFEWRESDPVVFIVRVVKMRDVLHWDLHSF